MSLAVHELRTPVTVVAGYIRMVLREQAGPLSEKQRRMLEEADRSCARISALVSEMSELGKLESRELALGAAPFDFAALVQEVASSMHEGDDRGVRLEPRGITDPIMVTGDRARLAAALRALMHAALRERGEPGVVVVECATITDNTDRQWVAAAIGDDAAVRVLIDSGRAAPPGFDEWRGGLGLALPIGRRVIEAHGGAVWSGAGEGARTGTAFRLPLSSR
jgi:two-component system cell cycle sensor histidine kinase PleC